jgi:anti-sigma28 factor (negative regulator of flagellin synthesis)
MHKVPHNSAQRVSVRIVSLLAITWDPETGQIGCPGGSFARGRTHSVESPAGGVNEFEVDVLSAARQFARFRAEIFSMPEIRRDRVAELLDKFESETYSASSRQIADAMLRDFQRDIGSFEQ